MRKSLFASLTMAEKSQLGSFINLNPTATETAKEKFIGNLRREVELKRFEAMQQAASLGIDVSSKIRDNGWMQSVMAEGFVILGTVAGTGGTKNPTWAMAIRRDIVGVEFIGKGKAHAFLLKAYGTDPKGVRSVKQIKDVLEALDMTVKKGRPEPKPVVIVKAPKLEIVVVPEPAPVVEPPKPEPIEPEVQVHWDRLNDRRTIGQAYSALKLSGIDLGPTVPARADDLKNLIRRHPQSRLARAVIVNFIGA